MAKYPESTLRRDYGKVREFVGEDTIPPYDQLSQEQKQNHANSYEIYQIQLESLSRQIRVGDSDAPPWR